MIDHCSQAPAEAPAPYSLNRDIVGKSSGDLYSPFLQIYLFYAKLLATPICCLLCFLFVCKERKYVIDEVIYAVVLQLFFNRPGEAGAVLQTAS